MNVELKIELNAMLLAKREWVLGAPLRQFLAAVVTVSNSVVHPEVEIATGKARGRFTLR